MASLWCRLLSICCSRLVSAVSVVVVAASNVCALLMRRDVMVI